MKRPSLAVTSLVIGLAFFTIAKITSVSKSSTDSSNAVTTATDTTSSTVFVSCISSYKVPTAPTMSSSPSTTWTAKTVRTSTNNARIQPFYANNPTTNSSQTFTGAGPGTFPAIAVLALSGTDTTTPFDQETGANAGSGTTLSTGSLTPTNDNSVLVACAMNDSNSVSSVNGGFTLDQNAAHTGNSEGIGLAYLIQTSKTAANPQFTFAGSGESAASMMVFNPTAAAPTFPPALFHAPHKGGIRVWRVR